MVIVQVDDSLHNIEKRLGALSYKAPKVLVKSINDTATWARREFAQEAKKTYTIKSGGFNRSMKIKKANYSSLEAIISSEGAPIELKQFKYSAGKKTTKAQVITSGGLKELQRNGIKAFVATFASGHTTIAQRRGSERLPIKVLFSNSIPMMLGNEKRVYGIVEPKIQEKLDEYISKHIKKVLEGYE